MSFFDSIKKNIHHGGVTVALQAPQSASLQDVSLPVSVTITATDAPAQINSVTASIVAQSFKKDMSHGSPGSDTQMTVAQAEYGQPLSLNTGETKTVPLSIAINSSQQPQNQLGKVEAAVGRMMDPNTYVYSVEARADVEGIALDPTARQKIQIQGTGGLTNHIEL